MEEHIPGAVGFNGKPVIDIRTLAIGRIPDLSRVQMRDMLYTLGKERPTWEIPKLRSMLYAVVTAIKTNNVEDMMALEAALGVTLPKGGHFRPKILPPELVVHKKSKAGQKILPSSQDQERWKKMKEKRLCATCGQMARANCFYKLCKNCCIQMKNPCTIHVLIDDKVFKGKAYGSDSTKVDYSDSFPKAPEVDTGSLPRLRDLRESVATFQEETAEILKWRNKVMENNERAEKEYAIEALERYENNAELLAEVMSVEELGQIILEPPKKKQHRSREELIELIKAEQNTLPTKDPENIQSKSKNISDMHSLMKNLTQTKHIGELHHRINMSRLLKNLKMNHLKMLGDWAVHQPVLKEQRVKYQDLPAVDKSSMIDVRVATHK